VTEPYRANVAGRDAPNSSSQGSSGGATSILASLARAFDDPEDVLQFVQLLACRAALEAENARRA